MTTSSPTFHVLIPGIASAEANDEASALRASRQLTDDASHFGCDVRLTRREIIITRSGQYDGRLTQAAREGRTP